MASRSLGTATCMSAERQSGKLWHTRAGDLDHQLARGVRDITMDLVSAGPDCAETSRGRWAWIRLKDALGQAAKRPSARPRFPSKMPPPRHARGLR